MFAYLLDIAILFALLAPAGLLIQAAIGFRPSTGPEIWGVLILNFSIPVWLYFWLSDASERGATLGKRVFGIRVSSLDGQPLEPLRALARTAVKLLPWEIAHLSAFGLSAALDLLSPIQGAGLAVANLSMLAYLWLAFASNGRRSAHDWAVASTIETAD